MSPFQQEYGYADKSVLVLNAPLQATGVTSPGVVRVLVKESAS